ncbi:MAG: hypothetical protein ACRCZI_10320 [Cetobacterium sp.]
MEGDFVADYDPTNSVLVEGDVPQNSYFRALQAERKAKAAARRHPRADSEIGLSTIKSSNPALYGEIVTRADRFKATVNVQENKRLKQALVSRFKTTP